MTTDLPAPSVTFRICGDQAVLVVFGEKIEAAANDLVRILITELRACRFDWLTELVPSYSSLLVQYDILQIDAEQVVLLVRNLLRRLSGGCSLPVPVMHEIPVCYGGEFGPDLDEVAEMTALPAETIIEKHSSIHYRIYAIGFTPGFCYLGELPAQLSVPRLRSPRPRVPSGSVGITGMQTGIYPLESPGGWRLIGRTPIQLFDFHRNPPVFYQVGDCVQFKPVSAADFDAFQLTGWHK